MIDIQSDDLGGNKINLSWESEDKNREKETWQTIYCYFLEYIGRQEMLWLLAVWVGGFLRPGIVT